MEDFHILKNIISKGLASGYMSSNNGNEIDMVNGRWILAGTNDIGSTWDIILSPKFAKILWGENYEEHLTKIVVMNSDDRTNYLKDFVEEDVEVIEAEEFPELAKDGLMYVIKKSLERVKEYSEGAYVDSCKDTHNDLKPIVNKTSVTELSEKDFIILNTSDQIMHSELSKYLNANGKASFTICPECGCDDFTHVEGCSIYIKSENFMIGDSEGC